MLKCSAALVISEPGLSENAHLLRVTERTYRILVVVVVVVVVGD
jgi:hypothetical protein